MVAQSPDLTINLGRQLVKCFFQSALEVWSLHRARKTLQWVLGDLWPWSVLHPSHWSAMEFWCKQHKFNDYPDIFMFQSCGGFQAFPVVIYLFVFLFQHAMSEALGQGTRFTALETWTTGWSKSSENAKTPSNIEIRCMYAE